MSQHIVKIPINNFTSVESAIVKINQSVEGKNLAGIFLNRLSLMRSEIELIVSEPMTRDRFIEIPVRQAKGYGSSQYRGVHWAKDEEKWRAVFSHKGKRKTLGRFTNEIEAAKAYDKVAFETLGADAYLNFPREVTN